jgi:dihydroorotate dehydrogenase electron transfer subunit
MCIPEGTKSALIEATISQHELVGTDLWRTALSVPGWDGPVPEPGQFVMVRASEGADPLLGRPFGIAGFERNEESSVFEIIYRVVGKGTGMMSRWSPGETVTFLGPLGRGFSLAPKGSKSILVAGGVGLPPLLALARRMAQLERAGEVTLLYGESSRDRLLHLESRVFPGIDTFTCTEDGSCGTKGLVTDLLADRMDEPETNLYVCGPNPMMKAVLELASGKDVSSQYSLEARMACGFGVCSGCAVMTAGSGYVRVCREGPVFGSEELVEESFRSV